MQSVAVKKCSNCKWVDRFDPRKDEAENGHILGCKYPGWEGYVEETDAIVCHTFTEVSNA